jgi:putative chitinase
MLDTFKGLIGDKLDEFVKDVTDTVQKQVPEPKIAAKGDPAVFELQKKLIARGAKITADGLMGPATKAAEKEFPDPTPVKSHVGSTSSTKSVVSLDTIKQLFPKHKNCTELCASLNVVLPKYGITSKDQVACFLAQCGHESAGFTVLVENLNYSSDGLCKTWPKRFTAATAGAYHRNPEKIANKVYCDRMGNGSEASGDGWKYRGSGFIQITGKDNYTKFSKSCGKSLDDTVEYCRTLPGAVESACWFWSENKLNTRFVDKKDFEGLTKAINGGLTGLSDRKHHYTEALRILNAS